jgi:hypothetical protein
MAETGKPRTRAGAKRPAAGAVGPEEWFCKNCGATNPDAVQECAHCGFGKDFDPDVQPELDFTSITATLGEQAEQRRQQLRFYLELLKNALLLILVVVFLILGFRLMGNWPFRGAYDQDSYALLNEVLTAQSRIEMGVNKGQYDDLVVPLMVENTKFKMKYGESAERQKESYQKLVQAAEYYKLAREAWDNQLTGGDRQTKADPNARSEAASDEVLRCWESAKRNALLALKDMH